MNCNCEFKKKDYICKNCKPLEDKKGYEWFFIIPSVLVLGLLAYEIFKTVSQCGQ